MSSDKTNREFYFPDWCVFTSQADWVKDQPGFKTPLSAWKNKWESDQLIVLATKESTNIELVVDQESQGKYQQKSKTDISG